VAGPYRVVYAPEVIAHVAAIPRKHHGLIRSAIGEQLTHGPDRPTKNRKPIQDLPGPFGSTWELRIGPDNRFRVFYEIVAQEVWVLAVGVKERDRLSVAGKEVRG
jgi:mRNA-degrading endonuclease RelE of RelBE toxin-antitoxin system